MVQKWIKCCSDASVCCTNHLKEQEQAEALLSSPLLSTVHDHNLHDGHGNLIKDRKLNKREGKWSTEFPSLFSQSSLSSWDLTSLVTGDEDLMATPSSRVTSADGSAPVEPVLPPDTLPPKAATGRRILHCPRTWDGWTCWKDDVAVGVTVEQPCPDHIYWKIAAPPCRG